MHEQIPIEAISMTKQETKLFSQVERAKRDPVAFTSLYRRYAIKVYRYIYVRVSNHQEAEDLTAQVFEAVLTGLQCFGDRKNFPAWLFTIARNKVVDNYRKRTPDLPLDAVHNIPADNTDPLNLVLDKEDLRSLAFLVQEMDADNQELIHLRFAAGLTYAEIGDVIGKSEGAVKMSLHRMLKQLQEKLENQDE